MVIITENAKNSLKDLANREKTKNFVYRIIKEGWGWRGPRMRLVQDEQDNVDHNENNIKIDNLSIVWGTDIDQMINRYGQLIIDHMKSLFGGKFIIHFESSGCWSYAPFF